MRGVMIAEVNAAAVWKLERRRGRALSRRIPRRRCDPAVWRRSLGSRRPAPDVSRRPLASRPLGPVGWRQRLVRHRPVPVAWTRRRGDPVSWKVTSDLRRLAPAVLRRRLVSRRRVPAVSRRPLASRPLGPVVWRVDRRLGPVVWRRRSGPHLCPMMIRATWFGRLTSHRTALRSARVGTSAVEGCCWPVGMMATRCCPSVFGAWS